MKILSFENALACDEVCWKNSARNIGEVSAVKVCSCIVSE